MKKYLLFFLSAMMLTFGCYDDTDIRLELQNHENRISELETLCSQFNTNIAATFVGCLNVAQSNLPFSQVTVYYSDAETFNMNAAKSVSATSFDEEQNFTIALVGLKIDTKYSYCVVTEVKSEKYYSDVLSFSTLERLGASDLTGAANCYIVSSTGSYMFKSVKGNSAESVGDVAAVSVLWESFG